jgi:hypothetical protein
MFKNERWFTLTGDSNLKYADSRKQWRGTINLRCYTVELTPPDNMVLTPIKGSAPKDAVVHKLLFKNGKERALWDDTITQVITIKNHPFLSFSLSLVCPQLTEKEP